MRRPALVRLAHAFKLVDVIVIVIIIIMIIIMMMINLFYIAQLDSNGILTALYSHKVHTNAMYVHMDIYETIIFIHIYMSAHIYIH